MCFHELLHAFLIPFPINHTSALKLKYAIVKTIPHTLFLKVHYNIAKIYGDRGQIDYAIEKYELAIR